MPTSIDIQPDTITDEELLAGNGRLGPFTFRKLRTDETFPPSLSAVAGAASAQAFELWPAVAYFASKTEVS